MFLNKYKEFAQPIVRYGVGIVFLLFGIDQIQNPQNWFTWTPQFVSTFYSNAENFWLLNGLFDIIVGVLLLAGLLTRIAAFLASVHLLGVIFTLGYNDISIRDFGLLLATISIFLNGEDKFCLDNKCGKIKALIIDNCVD